MKQILVLIFALYLLVIGTLPCADWQECASMSSHNTATHQHKEHKEQKEKHQEQCPPFCACACCGISIVVFASIHAIINHITVSVAQKLSFYTSIFAQDFCIAIWQPPKFNFIG
ncbi:MAG: hypothetical protein KA783_02025 [Chitinophagales bacterium]|nr:hypothetical protein [Chitinophagales bacterium]MBP7533196.1 hypothetical protein [Chitinophagales bacterium]